MLLGVSKDTTHLPGQSSRGFVGWQSPCWAAAKHAEGLVRPSSNDAIPSSSSEGPNTMDIELLLPAAVCRQTQARACMPGLWRIQVPCNKDTLHYLILQVRQAAHRLGLQLALLHHAELQMISRLTLALHTSTKGTGTGTAATTHITA